MKPLFGNRQWSIPAVRAAGWFPLVFLGLMAAVHGADLPTPVTLDVPIPLNRALPAWIGQPDTPPNIFATLNLPIVPPDATSSLLVTVYFQEKQGGFMRILWAGPQGAQTLADNFYEDIGMANQRSLLIAPETLLGNGTLSFQCGDSTLGIQRIKLEWLATRDSLVSPQVQDTLVTPSSGLTEPSLTLSGTPIATVPGAWQNLIVTVPMTDAPVRIEQGVDFSVDLDEVPGTARIGLEETGLPLGKHLVVWVNQQRAGTASPTVPDLRDAGYLVDAKAVTNYVGWRDVSFSVPVSLLTAGVNAVQFSTEDDLDTGASGTAAGADAPLAIKALVMQLNYTPAPATAIPLFPAATMASTSVATPTVDSASAPDPTPDATTDAATSSAPQLLSPADPTLRPVDSATSTESTTP
jgi:hypothetical protein